MKYIISVWEWIFAVSLFIIFLIWFLIVASLWPYKKYIIWVRAYLRTFFKLLFIKVEVIYEAPIDDKENHIFMANHVSMFDIPLVVGFIPKDFWGIQAASHFKVPLYGWVLKKYGNLPIDRSSPRASYKTMMDAVEQIKEGKNILILPEGTRAKTPVMGPFKKLPFVMVKKAEVSIIPMAFVGLWDINNKTSWMINPRKMKVVFGKPIDVDTVKSLPEEELRKLTRERLESLLLRFK